MAISKVASVAKGLGVEGVTEPVLPPGYGEPLLLPPDLRILLIADTGAGKTTQIGVLAEYIYATEGKTTVVFGGDKGGIRPLTPYINMGIVKVYPYLKTIDPWIWISHAVHGEAMVDGKWKKVVDPKVDGLVAEEGLTAYADLMMLDLARVSAENPTAAVGGESAWSFEARQGSEVIKMASNTQSHYGLTQLRIMHEIWDAELGVPSIWTALLVRTSDNLGGGVILGGQTAGNKQSTSLPRWFDITMRMDAVPQEGAPARHLLYLETHKDKMSKGAKVIANARLPLAGASVKVDSVIEPADLVTALLQIDKRGKAAETEIKERIERIRGRVK